MALLQIGGGPKEKCAGRVAGIDLGTTYSLVSIVRGGTPEVLPVGDGVSRTLPSVVWFGPEGRVEVGERARSRAAERAEGTIASAKRFMGRSQKEVLEARGLQPYRFSDNLEDPVVRFKVAEDRYVTPMEVGAEVLRILSARAEKALEGPLDGVVITVPAYFDDAQRQATKDAARLVGLTVLRLLNEPTAAALAYGLDKQKEGLFAVFDLGGGTFDISLLRLEGGVFQVLTTGGDAQLGGDDFDRAVAEHFLLEKYKDLQDVPTELAAEAIASARKAKEILTTADTATIKIAHDQYHLDRETFNELIRPVLGRCLKPIKRVLSDADLEGEELDGVVLVGGSTRVPAVQAFVEQAFGQKPLSDLDPDQVVAMGAAVQADLLGGSGPRDDVLLLDVLPLSLGIETMGGVVEKVLHRNQAIPTTATQEFTTYADGQTGMSFHVVQGEREMVVDCRSLARFNLKGLPPMGAGMARIEVRFSVDADGILDVSAEEATAGVRAHVEVKPAYGLSDDTIEQMILSSLEHAEDDVSQRVLAEAKVEAERILAALEGALLVDHSLLAGNEERRIEEARARLRTALGSDDPTAINEQVMRLDEASAAFAARRMNRSLQEVLAGQTPDQVTGSS
ncbi:MAG: Fe-S protein assembly chaperone HscA [Myxococcales bacterium]|nr:Fe-S protein assembly chaperone HscA [Myxococcales bacterium]